LRFEFEWNEWREKRKAFGEVFRQLAFGRRRAALDDAGYAAK